MGLLARSTAGRSSAAFVGKQALIAKSNALKHGITIILEFTVCTS
jgi:hypothetical protein